MADNINMEVSSEIKEEVYKCSKCGLCKSVCPVFLALKNEMELARGRYIVLNAFFNLSKNLNKKFIKELDLCLNCNLCKRFCPSNIDAYKVFTFFKKEFHYKFSLFNFSFLYRLWLNVLRIFAILYRLFPFKIFVRNSYFNNLFFVKTKRLKQGVIKQNKKKIYYFEGCVNKYINPSDKNACLNIIEKTGFSIAGIISECCGYPYINEGNFEKYKNQINKILNNVSEDADYIICSCDTCLDTLKKAAEYTGCDKRILSKIVSIDEFLKLNNFSFDKKGNSVYFKPLLRENPCYFTSEITEIKKKGLCSLMENFFILKYPKISDKIIESAFYDKEEIDGKTIVTSCQLSKVGLLKCIQKKKYNVSVLSYAEYISDEK